MGIAFLPEGSLVSVAETINVGLILFLEMVKMLVRIGPKILPDPKSAILAWTEDYSSFIDCLDVEYWGDSIPHGHSIDKKIVGIFLTLATQFL